VFCSICVSVCFFSALTLLVGSLTRKNPSPYDLYCVGGMLSLTQSINRPLDTVKLLQLEEHRRR